MHVEIADRGPSFRVMVVKINSVTQIGDAKDRNLLSLRKRQKRVNKRARSKSYYLTG